LQNVAGEVFVAEQIVKFLGGGLGEYNRYFYVTSATADAANAAAALNADTETGQLGGTHGIDLKEGGSKDWCCP
jgi:hypothetical protein